MTDNTTALTKLLSVMFQAHPWHGVSPGLNAPQIVTAYIEILPSDTVKYELDKPSGHLRIDRPHQFSSLSPMPYGFIPQTFCGDRIAAYCRERTGLDVQKGDGDPLDICVLTEKTITHGDILVGVKPIGGLLMIDKNEADDKIIAVLTGDVAFGHLSDISECPPGLIDRLRHYFLSYKQLPGESPRRVEITRTYGSAEAYETINRSITDYHTDYGSPQERVAELRRLLLET